ncbi:hypothetical protein Goklo_006676 [Gossypium klotzschianum]|uniref:Uncharacterized protein n=1 Tax=Gossypium klotzschianum TaxID=34286 RepID=A0A7J8VIF9_9ROSI|nr:hypothetical protein [Gossypium klotzschianum]
MEKGFLDKVKDNAAVRAWSEMTQHEKDTKKRVDVFTLSMYGLVVFPKALGHVNEAVTDLFNRLDRGLHQSQ